MFGNVVVSQREDGYGVNSRRESLRVFISFCATNGKVVQTEVRDFEQVFRLPVLLCDCPGIRTGAWHKDLA